MLSPMERLPQELLESVLDISLPARHRVLRAEELRLVCKQWCMVISTCSRF